MLDLAATCLVFTALLAYLNHRFVGLPTAIGVMVIALVLSLAVLGLDLMGLDYGLRHFQESFLRKNRLLGRPDAGHAFAPAVCQGAARRPGGTETFSVSTLPCRAAPASRSLGGLQNAGHVGGSYRRASDRNVRHPCRVAGDALSGTRSSPGGSSVSDNSCATERSACASRSTIHGLGWWLKQQRVP